jgi:alkanesulfonate monooxygenase SsuD/methylene tetrahydromethanopterin reductase-like flavin-dependent oxidoreductase (luciferase family)
MRNPFYSIYRDFKAKVVELGRDPDDARVAPAVYIVPGTSQAMAATTARR